MENNKKLTERLTPKKAKLIYDDYMTGEYRRKDLEIKYGVSKQTLHRLINKETYKYIHTDKYKEL